jgi:hypothetical protein
MSDHRRRNNQKVVNCPVCGGHPTFWALGYDIWGHLCGDVVAVYWNDTTFTNGDWMELVP